MKQRKPILALLVAAALLPWLTVSARAADTDVMFSDPSVVVGNTVTVNVYTTSAVAGIDLTLADYCVTLTLTQLDGVNAVSITSGGRELPYRITAGVCASWTTAAAARGNFLST